MISRFLRRSSYYYINFNSFHHKCCCCCAIFIWLQAINDVRVYIVCFPSSTYRAQSQVKDQMIKLLPMLCYSLNNCIRLSFHFISLSCGFSLHRCLVFIFSWTCLAHLVLYFISLIFFPLLVSSTAAVQICSREKKWKDHHAWYQLCNENILQLACAWSS